MLKRMPMTKAPPAVHGRVFIRKDRCKGCQFCIEFCPQGVLALSKDYNVKGYRYPVVVKDVCVNCTLCISLCPDYAILSRRIPEEEIAAAAKGPAPTTNEDRRRAG